MSIKYQYIKIPTGPVDNEITADIAAECVSVLCFILTAPGSRERALKGVEMLNLDFQEAIDEAFPNVH